MNINSVAELQSQLVRLSASGTANDSVIAPNSAADPTAPDAWWSSPRYAPAFKGNLAGNIVDALWQFTEASAFAILLQFLVAFGNAIGRTAYQLVEQDRHYGNLFVVLVGDTSRARKGSSWGHVRRIMAIADTDWLQRCVVHGVSTGEGIIHSLRDADGEDAGVEDKRALILASEFQQLLTVMSRNGNTLSSVLREAWDRGDLRTMSKGCPQQATDAHISVIAHITAAELKRVLSTTEMLNGFANRFAWMAVHRSKLLPDGGNIPDGTIEQLAAKVREALAFARTVPMLRRDEDGRALWHAHYERLTSGHAGLVGAVTDRAEAQVLRLSTLYCLLDGSPTIRTKHIEAAIALWNACEDSTRAIFGDATGNPIADKIADAVLKSGIGLSKTTIRDLFHRHATQAEIETAINTLVAAGRVRVETARTGGRPATILLPPETH